MCIVFIIGVCVVFVDVLIYMCVKGILKVNLFKYMIVVLLVGIYKGMFIVDLEYIEDFEVEIDMNIVMMEIGKLIEV